MNSVVLVGRLTRRPEVRYSDSGTVFAKYSLAVDRPFKRPNQPTADFINCVAFGKTAEFAEKYLDKGVKIGVTGRIQTGSYKAQDGRTVKTTDVVVDSQEFMTSRAENGSQSVSEDSKPKQEWTDAADEELPFI